MTATLRPVARPLQSVTDTQKRRLDRAGAKRETAESDYRATVLAVMAEGASFAEVSRATGLSTNTLQRWKRDAGGRRDG